LDCQNARSLYFVAQSVAYPYPEFPGFGKNELLKDCRCMVVVRRLCECWHSAVETVTSRQRTLESMLAESRQFEQLYVDTDRWIVQTSQRCLQDDIGNDVATVKQQKDIIEVCRFISEIKGSFI